MVGIGETYQKKTRRSDQALKIFVNLPGTANQR